MGKNNRAWLIIVAICILATACKLDNVPPSAANTINDDETVLGITVISRKIYDSYLTSAWKVSTTIIDYYDDKGVVVSGKATDNLFSGVNLNDNTQALSFVKLSANLGPSSGNYTLSTNDNVLYMKLPGDVFSRSKNTPIRITRLNASSMVWVALDSASSVVNSQTVFKAHKVIFYK